MKHLATLRRTVAVATLVAITLLFVDFTATVASLFGWLAKIQFVPALLAINITALAVIVVMTLLFGRLYCSVVCPLGVMQDLFARLGRGRRPNRYHYTAPHQVLQSIVFVLFTMALLADFTLLVGLLGPYSIFGRIISTTLVPLWRDGNNLLADWSAAHDNYIFYHVSQYPVATSLAAIGGVSLVVIAALALTGGRTYCNAVCPVGYILGYLGKFAWFKPHINTSRCNSCGLCERNCKSGCIDSKSHTIDYQRCVTCFDCLSHCHRGALTYCHTKSTPAGSGKKIDTSRRNFLTTTAIVAGAAVASAADMHLDGGLAPITSKQRPERKHPVTPPGSVSHANLNKHCTGCQLCVAACPNRVLQPATNFNDLLKPHCSYEHGYCRPECNKCSQVCPTGAIKPVTVEQRTATQVGIARWVRERCLPATDGTHCGNCSRHCPAEAIIMVHLNAGDPDSPLIPTVNESRCIGCGACEYVCPSRPLSAMIVDGHINHHTL